MPEGCMEDTRKSIMNIGIIKGTLEKLQQTKMLILFGLQVDSGFNRSMNSMNVR